MENSLKRVYSIDIFRALTMFMMIFVNDLWTLFNIPYWLEHSKADVDFLGVSDVVFPCFLVILGMSVPLAIQKRLEKGESKLEVLKHIVIRSVALLIMGVFTVNVPEINEEVTGMSSAWFQILMVTGFFLVWNVYPEDRKSLSPVLKIAGVILLCYLAFIFRSGNGQDISRMTSQWWGILGLIGWAYLGCAVIYLFTFRHLFIQITALAFFLLLTVAGHSGWLKLIWPEGPGDWITGNGAFHAFTYAGIVATLLADKIRSLGKQTQLPLLFAGTGILFIISGIIARNFFIISKIYATPTWILLCTGIAFILYGIVCFITDVRKKAHWFDVIKTAGTSTLTCYLIPYIYYSVAEMLPFSIPESLRTGGVGIIKSILFSLLIIYIATLAGKMRIRLKI